MEIEKSWSNTATVICLIVVAIIEAWQQAASGLPSAVGVLPRLGGAWHLVPLILLVAAGVFWIIGRYRGTHIRGQQQASTAQDVASSALAPAIASPTPSPIDVDVFFRLAYSGQLQTETEGNIRAMIQSRPPNERDGFVVKFIATGLINAVYDHIWLTIYRSQVLALTELNRTLLRFEQVKAYYDDATQKFAVLYAKYSFEEWLQYLRAQILLLEHPGRTFEITVRGKDFLKYMVHCGYTADGRSY